MKFSVTVGGQHQATVTADLDGKGAFTGTIESPEYGKGTITNGVQDGNHLTGKVTLDGHEADFDATISAQAIAGTLTDTVLFFPITMNFSGFQAED